MTPIRSWPRAFASLVACLLLLVACGETGSLAGTHDDLQGRRAILVSIDALNEPTLRRTLSPEEAPNHYRLLEEGICAEHATVGLPSVTPTSHATLWTGALADVHGATAGGQHRLPRSENRVTETISGFSYEVLSAEPLWVTAGRAGVPVTGHHVTQAPGLPGYPPRDGVRSAAAEEARARAERALAREDVNVLNGYNTTLVGHTLLRAADLTREDAATWSDLDEVPALPTPLAFRWTNPVGTFHLLVHGTGGTDGYGAVTVARGPDPSVLGGVEARYASLESDPVEGRALARHFSEALQLPVDGGRVHLRVRVFEMEPDGSDFLLYHPSMHVVEGNRPDLMAAYDQAVGGWLGNSAFQLYRSGAFGPTIALDGDGTAEARYMETVELLTRQFERGSEWLWEHHEPRLQMDYFPLGDAIDHELLGFLDPEAPGHDPAMAARIRDFRAQVWGMVDRRLGHLMGLAARSDGAIFVSGDHGMRSSWRYFRPNLALLEAGLLHLDENGGVDLSRTRAIAPNGYFISVNREAWIDGIVPPDQEVDVIAAARAAILAVRGEEGRPVVTRTFLPGETDGWGIGGPAGGDLYWGTAPGFRSTASRAGSGPVSDAPLWAGHGFPPDEPDMYTVFCGFGGGLGTGRFGAVPLTAVAPTVAEYTGIPRPADAGSSSVLSSMW